MLIQRMSETKQFQTVYMIDQICKRQIIRTFTYPVVWWTVGEPQMTWQPAPSIPLASQPSSWRRPASCQSIPGCCPLISFLSASPSLYCAVQDCLGKPCRSCYVPVPFQFASLSCSQEFFVGPNGLPSSVSLLFVGGVVYVCDAQPLRRCESSGEIAQEGEVSRSGQRPSGAGAGRGRRHDKRPTDYLQQDLADMEVAHAVDPISHHHPLKERQPELSYHQPHQPPEQSYAEDLAELTEAASGNDHR